MIKQPKPIVFTKSGYSALRPKLDELFKKRERVLIELQRAREQGDLSENGAYKAARFELGDTDRAIRQLQHQIKYGKAIEPPTDGTIGVGSTVKLRRDDGKEFTYTIVGTYEADPMNGKISIESPMGKALIGKKADDEVVVNEKKYLVLS
ncbi:MAG: transcription elongation factor GreA [bacterium]|nr:transcription elongation factor GreA [Candidatus Microgenomates bacterium CPR3]MCQ3944599.1 transcription elongation factor GreA [bacterium]RIK51587.1 MAG: transcription elongation factor GreA [Candidatus Microgenomates bacterium]